LLYDLLDSYFGKYLNIIIIQSYRIRDVRVLCVDKRQTDEGYVYARERLFVDHQLCIHRLQFLKCLRIRLHSQILN
jgi:hypothetical protein